MDQLKHKLGLFHSVWAPAEAAVQQSIPANPQSVLLLCGDLSTAQSLQQEVERRWPAGSRVAAVIPGMDYAETAPGRFTVNPGNEADYGKLAEALRRSGFTPGYIVYNWSGNCETDNFRQSKADGAAVYSLVQLAHCFMSAGGAGGGRLLYSYQAIDGAPAPEHAAAAAFLKSLSRERRGWLTKVVEWGCPDSGPADRMRLLLAELQQGGEGDIRIGADLTRTERCWEQLHTGVSSMHSPVRIRENGTYIITGGLGAIGLACARHLARQANVKLYLLGRSPLGAAGARQLTALENLGSTAYYQQVDVSNAAEVALAINGIRDRKETIAGLIHCAGLIRDSLLQSKPIADFQAVLAAKVQGTVNLDEATKNDPLDFFVMASSVMAVLGNIGQTDYAYANRYMDHYAVLREQYRRRGERSGHTVSIGWPLWKDGGMQIKADEASVLHRSGLAEMPEEIGLNAFDLSLRLRIPHVLVAYGDIRAAEEGFNRKVHAALMSPPANGSGVTAAVMEYTAGYFRELLGTLLKAPQSAFEGTRGFHHLGIDSITVNAFNAAVERKIGSMSKTLLYESSSVSDLVDYALLHHRDQILRLFAAAAAAERPASPWQQLVSLKPKMHTAWGAESLGGKQTAFSDRDGAIAVIGLSGRYPGASDLNAFWELLKTGSSTIREVPADRWSVDDYYDPDPFSWKNGKMNSKWGGFLEDVDSFDPLLFRISPKEAETIDPQERVFLETAWEALEDAGQLHEGNSRKTGVFVGATTNTYMLKATDGHYPSGLPTSLPWSLANRVSYYFDLQGPSMPVDTACSSSLTAIHLACDSLRRGECETALAGGVNLYLHPLKYTYLSQMGMLSPTGTCSSFGAGGDGFVPGEGAGAVVLKPLHAALRDGDSIYALIKGTAVNHGGLTTGYTVPNPLAQAEVVTSAMKAAGVDPRTISYIEAHGTGTVLGDPLEIAGLTRAFREHTKESGFCAVGSVKTNIGHLEAAAGIAGLTKVLLQMKHRQLVASLHAEQVNPNIRFEDTPFYVQKDTAPWHSSGDAGQAFAKLPRRAGVSSFGAGGSNAHIVVEEYPAEHQEHLEERDGGSPSAELILLSARNPERLRAYVLRLREYVRQPEQGVKLADVAYTLRTGRRVMEARLAVVATDFGGLEQQLDAYLLSANTTHELGNEGAASGAQTDGAEQKTAKSAEECLSSNDLYGLADLWNRGASIPWNDQARPSGARRVTLPSYPFERRNCSLPVPSAPEAVKLRPERSQGWSVPLVTTPKATEPYKGQEVQLEIVNGCIALVTLNDPANRNMYSDRMQDGLLSVFQTIDSHEELKVVIVTGTDRLFCMGGTRDQLEGIANQKAKCVDTAFAYRGLLECRLPVIAAMQGHAVGGGLAFGLFADIVIMSEESVYSSNYMQYGFTPGVGATYIFAEKLGTALAQEMMYTAKAFRGIELKERGASVAFAKSADVLKEAFVTARMLIKKPLLTLTVLKRELAGRVLEKLPGILQREVIMHDTLFSQMDVSPLIQHFFGTKPEDVKASSDASNPTVPMKHQQPAATAGQTGGKPSVSLRLRPPQEQSSGPAAGPTAVAVQNKIALLQPFARPELGRTRISEGQRSAADPYGAPVAAAAETTGFMSFQDMKRRLEDTLCGMLHMERHELQGNTSFRDLGVDSISGVELMNEMNRSLGLNLSAVLIYDYSTVEELARHISTEYAPGQPAGQKGRHTNDEAEEKAVRHSVADIFSRLLHVRPEELAPNTVFRDLGVDSISGVELVRELSLALDLSLSATIIYDFPTLDELCRYLIQERSGKQGQAETYRTQESSQDQEALSLLERLQSEQLDIDTVDQWLEGWR